LKHLFEIGEPADDPALADPDATLPQPRRKTPPRKRPQTSQFPTARKFQSGARARGRSSDSRQ
jgi:hypothetical protein